MNLQRATVVYCAGGMRSDWVARLKAATKGMGFLLIDPKDHGCQHEKDYTGWDLTGVDLCDVVLGYMEEDNPGGPGLALEFGWAAKAGKHLILIEEPGYPQEPYLGMARAVSHRVEKTTRDAFLATALGCLSDYRLRPKSLQA